MTKILWHSETPFTPSGYGNQTERITTGLANKGFDMALLGWQYVGNKLIIQRDENDKPKRQLFSGDGYGFGQGTTPFVIKEFEPDGVICLGDWWMNSFVHLIPREYDYWTSHWLPIDGIPFGNHTKWSDAFNSANLLVNMSKFGHRQFQEGIQQARDDNKAVTLENTLIPHGIDTIAYSRASESEIAEEKEFLEIDPEAMVIGVVARNQPRKNYPRLIETFTSWVRDKELTEKDVVLYLHCAPQDSAGWNLDFLLKGYDMEKIIILNPLLQIPSFGIAPERMKNFYSMMDAKLLPTAGEGFGIPSAEALSCETPLAITNFTNSAEFMQVGGIDILDDESLINKITGELIDNGGNEEGFINTDNGWLISYDDIFTHMGNVNRAQIGRKGMYNWFDELFYLFHNKKEKLKAMGRKGRELVKRHYKIEDVIDKWSKKIEFMEDDYKNRSLKPLPFLHSFDEAYMWARKMDANQSYCKTEINTMLDFIKKSDIQDVNTVLDLGCGSGESMKRLNREGFITVGCDISKEAVKFCRKAGLSVFLANGENLIDNMTKYGMKDIVFDMIVSQHTMEHCEDWKSFLENCLAIAKKVVFITVPHDNMRDKTHVKKYTEETMSEIKTFVKPYQEVYDFEYNKVGDKFLTVSYVMMFKRKKFLGQPI
jgi:glycosyltransferase involved in cell wall biosynthesis/SAM-dependent methyltransferase